MNPVLGNPDGDVTIVEFFDYQCPWCKKGHPDVMSAIAEDGNVRLLMRDWPTSILGFHRGCGARRNSATPRSGSSDYRPPSMMLISRSEGSSVRRNASMSPSCWSESCRGFNSLLPKAAAGA